MYQADLPTSQYILTTIANNMVAIVETATSENRHRGEYSLSSSCVSRNIKNGRFVEVSAEGHNGRLYVLADDLQRA